IKVIDIYSQPEWSALVVGEDSDITGPGDLAGRAVAATPGTDPYFFLVQALAEAGLSIDDVELQPLQHADGRSALEGGSVEAWSGLDPIMAAAEVESGARLVFRAVDFNTYGFLNATEEFIDQHADVAQVVVDTYEQARTRALANPEGTAQLLADAAGLARSGPDRPVGRRTRRRPPHPLGPAGRAGGGRCAAAAADPGRLAAGHLDRARARLPTARPAHGAAGRRRPRLPRRAGPAHRDLR